MSVVEQAERAKVQIGDVVYYRDTLPQDVLDIMKDIDTIQGELNQFKRWEGIATIAINKLIGDLNQVIKDKETEEGMFEKVPE